MTGFVDDNGRRGSAFLPGGGKIPQVQKSAGRRWPVDARYYLDLKSSSEIKHTVFENQDKSRIFKNSMKIDFFLKNRQKLAKLMKTNFHDFFLLQET